MTNETQKRVTDQYRSAWDQIFAPKPELTTPVKPAPAK
jgi:hypothetical protein